MVHLITPGCPQKVLLHMRMLIVVLLPSQHIHFRQGKKLIYNIFCYLAINSLSFYCDAVEPFHSL